MPQRFMKLGSRFFFRFVATTAALAFCLFSAASAQTTYTITDLGGLRGGDSSGTRINASGQIAGSSGGDAFLYSGGTMTDLGVLGTGIFSLGLGINNSGQVVGVSATDFDELDHAFLYSGGTMTDLGTLGGTRSWAFSINNLSEITGFSYTSNAVHVFLVSGGIMSDLGTLGGAFGEGFGINDSGQVTGISDTTDDEFQHAFLYSGGTMTDLGTLGGDSSQGNGINASGEVTGSSSTSADNAIHAFSYSGGRMTDLGTLGGSFSSGFGINSFGQIVGESSTTPFGNVVHAFICTPGVGMVDLNTLIPSDSGWILRGAFGINDSGQITGYGTNPSGLSHAFLLTPVTVPFSTFDARLGLTGKPPTKFRIRGSFTLGAGSTGIDPVNQPVTLKLGTFSVSIPTGSFTTTAKGDYDFQGTVGGVAILFRITSVASTSFTWEAKGATNTGLPATNPVSVGLTIGNNTGTVSVTAHGQGK
jgi:probable HAF family extracellular repeat protein